MFTDLFESVKKVSEAKEGKIIGYLLYHPLYDDENEVTKYDIEEGKPGAFSASTFEEYIVDNKGNKDAVNQLKKDGYAIFPDGRDTGMYGVVRNAEDIDKVKAKVLEAWNKYKENSPKYAEFIKRKQEQQGEDKKKFSEYTKAKANRKYQLNNETYHTYNIFHGRYGEVDKYAGTVLGNIIEDLAAYGDEWEDFAPSALQKEIAGIDGPRDFVKIKKALLKKGAYVCTWEEGTYAIAKDKKEAKLLALSADSGDKEDVDDII